MQRKRDMRIMPNAPTSFQIHRHTPQNECSIIPPPILLMRPQQWCVIPHELQRTQRTRNVLELVMSVRFIFRDNRALSVSRSVWQPGSGLWEAVSTARLLGPMAFIVYCSIWEYLLVWLDHSEGCCLLTASGIQEIEGLVAFVCETHWMFNE